VVNLFIPLYDEKLSPDSRIEEQGIKFGIGRFNGTLERTLVLQVLNLSRQGKMTTESTLLPY